MDGAGAELPIGSDGLEVKIIHNSPCGAGNLARSRLSAGQTRWKAGLQPG
jgi:hypothetical protein